MKLKDLALFILAGICAGLIYFISQNKSSLAVHNNVVQPNTAYPVKSYAAAVAKAGASVVNIYANKVVTEQTMAVIRDPAIRKFLGVRGFNVPRKRLERSLGSAVILDKQGYMVTNLHLILGAAEIRAIMSDGSEASAVIVGKDPETDLAILKLDSDVPVQAIKISKNGAAQVGDVVLAIGNPFGIGQAVTLGIISATDRSQTFANTSTRLLQTDAAINDGNSGGALVDADGDLVGINSAQLVASENVHGIGFALPVELVLKVYQDIITFGVVQRGWIGLEDSEYVTSKRDGIHGIRILKITPQSPAEDAALAVGDVITMINGKSIEYPNAVGDYIAQSSPDSNITLQIRREKDEFQVELQTIQAPIVK